MRTKMDTEYYLSAFDTSKENLEKLVSEALKHGGDWCDFFFENTVNGNIALRDGIVSDGGFNVDYGAGIRVLNGEKTGYAYSENTDMKSMAAEILCFFPRSWRTCAVGSHAERPQICPAFMSASGAEACRDS